MTTETLNNNIETTGAPSEEAVKDTFTLAEVNELLQKEGDRRVNSALAKKQKEIATLRKQIENQKTLSELDADARATAEKDMRITELEEQLSEYRLMQSKAEVMKTLNARGLSAELADYIKIGEDVEANQQIIDQIDKIIKREVQAGVKRRLAETSNIPQIASAPTGALTKEQFRKLKLSEKQALFDSDPELYKSLI